MIHIVGNYITLPQKNNVNNHDKENNIIFVGKMSYEPNIVATEYFVKDIFPRVKERHAEVNFTIIGASPIKRVMELSKQENVKVTGFVDNLDEYYNNATILVAPMLSGAGIQNKLLQGMAHKCCIATSPIGAEGLLVNDEIAIYSTTEAWIDGICELLQNRDRRKQMGLKAYEYIQNNMSKNIIRDQFIDFISAGVRHNSNYF